MTVSTTAAALLTWAFSLSLFFNWFWLGKLNQYRDSYELELEINEHNARHFKHIEETLVNNVVEIANVTELSKLTYEKYIVLSDLYEMPDLKQFRVPAYQITDNKNGTAFYWNITDVNELEAYEIARLWLRGVL